MDDTFQKILDIIHFRLNNPIEEERVEPFTVGFADNLEKVISVETGKKAVIYNPSYHRRRREDTYLDLEFETLEDFLSVLVGTKTLPVLYSEKKVFGDSFHLCNLQHLL